MIETTMYPSTDLPPHSSKSPESTSSTTTHVGAKIKQYRLYLGFSVADLSTATNMPIEDVLRLESGIADPSERDLAALAKLFRVRVESLSNQVDLESVVVDKALFAGLSPHDAVEVQKFADYLHETCRAQAKKKIENTNNLSVNSIAVDPAKRSAS